MQNSGAATIAGARPSFGKRRFMRFVGRNVKLVAGAVIIVVLLGMALAGPFVWPVDPAKQVLVERLLPPDWTGEHPLGTDHLGRDALARVIHGAKISLAVGALATGIALVLGVVLGLVAGYYGGWLDFLIMKVVEFFMALPGILVAIAIMAIFGAGFWNLVFILGLTRWVGFCRQVRGEVLTLKGQEFVSGARTIGASDIHIMIRHLLVNLIPSTTIVATYTLATIVLTEASLSFLGVGIPVEIPTWGVMLNEGRSFVLRAWWLSVFPGGAIFCLVLGVNLFGDGLRDYLDPRLRRT